MPSSSHRPPPAPDVCPVCGEDVPRGAVACPECGADHRSGWSAGADESGGLDLPDEEFDYDAFVEREFGTSRKPAGVSAFWWVTAIVLLAALLVLYVWWGVR